MQQRRGTAAQWTAANPTLAAGEIGFETDTNQFKIGNGSSAWAVLSYFKNLDGLDGVGGIVTLNAQGVIDVALIPQGVALDAELTQYIDDHNADQTSVHGISNTANLVYTADMTSTVNNAISVEVDNRNAAIVTAIDQEVADRNTAIVAAIADEVTDRNEAIVDAIAAEVANRGEAIDTAIATEVGNRNNAIGSEIGTHSSDTTSVHGIADTTVLETISGAQAKAEAALSSATTALTNHNSTTTNVHGIADTALLALKSEVAAVTPATLGLENVNNTSDANKPVSTATQTALDLKAPLASPTFTGTVVLPTVTAGGSIVPSTDNTYDLGSPTKMWKDLYVGPGSLYVNGQKVLHDESGNIVVRADANENLSLRTSGSGNVELDATGTGNIQIKSAMVIEGGSNITSSDGNAIVFGNAINADAISSKSANTDLSLTGNGSGKVNIADNAEVTGNLVVGGNLTVSGTTTTVNSETISLADNIIDLNSNFTSGVPSENAGIKIKRGDSNDVQIRWNESSDVWQFTNDGSTYDNIAGKTEVDLKAPSASPTFTGTVTLPAAGIVFSDGTQAKAGVPSITTFAAALTSSATLSAGEQDKFVPLAGAVTITLPATGYSTGQSIDFYQASGTGAQFASTNSVVGTPGLKLRTTNSVATAMKTSSGWLVFGDLSA